MAAEIPWWRALGLIETMRSVGFPRTGFVHHAARAAMGRGDPDSARRLSVNALDAIPDGGTVYAAIENVALAVELGDLDLARRIFAKAVPPGPTGRGYLSMLATATLAEAEGDAAAASASYEEAGTHFAARGWPWYRATALAGTGRCLVAMGATLRRVSRRCVRRAGSRSRFRRRR